MGEYSLDNYSIEEKHLPSIKFYSFSGDTHSENNLALRKIQLKETIFLRKPERNPLSKKKSKDLVVGSFSDMTLS